MLRIAGLALLISTLVLATPVAAQTDDSPPEPSPEFLAATELLESDPAVAREQLEGLADNGDLFALNLLGGILMAGREADPVRAESLFRKAIALGDDAARLNLATHILAGTLDGDPVEALALIDAITNERLLPFTAYPRARAYLFGLGVPQDLALGGALIIEAAARSPDNLDARFLAGRVLTNGWGVPADPAAAREHLRYAADRGAAAAQWNLGMLLLEGRGGPADPVEARRYVRMAAESGFYQGQISMAVMLALGQGGPIDEAEARDWYGRAADQGSAHAMRGLGMMLLLGQGGPEDPVLGWALLELAAGAGDPNATKLIELFLAEGYKPDHEAVDEARRYIVERTGEPWLE